MIVTRGLSEDPATGISQVDLEKIQIIFLLTIHSAVKTAPEK
jgi:hypothetical protein